MEQARLAIARIILGERDVEIECQADADDLAAAVRRSSSVHPDAMAGHERFPDGSRVLTEQPPGDLPLAEQRAMICTAISHSVGGTLTIRTRPLTSNPPIDAFAKCVVDPAMTVKNNLNVTGANRPCFGPNIFVANASSQKLCCRTLPDVSRTLESCCFRLALLLGQLHNPLP